MHISFKMLIKIFNLCLHLPTCMMCLHLEGLKAVLNDDKTYILPWQQFNHNNQSFSTWDRRNDRNEERDCAKYYGAGWWFNACHSTLLTGVNQNCYKTFWSRVVGRLKSAAMMIRPAE